MATALLVIAHDGIHSEAPQSASPISRLSMAADASCAVADFCAAGLIIGVR
jgi:hypothetical protein